MDKTTLEELEAALKEDDSELCAELLWQALREQEGCIFETAKGLSFTYTIKGNEIFFSRKEKSVTRASVIKALETAMELKRAGLPVSGPKKLRCFGGSYLYPVFIHLGIIQFPL